MLSPSRHDLNIGGGGKLKIAKRKRTTTFGNSESQQRLQRSSEAIFDPASAWHALHQHQQQQQQQPVVGDADNCDNSSNGGIRHLFSPPGYRQQQHVTIQLVIQREKMKPSSVNTPVATLSDANCGGGGAVVVVVEECSKRLTLMLLLRLLLSVAFRSVASATPPPLPRNAS